MTKYIKKEELENLIKSNVSAGLANSTIYTWLIGVLFLIAMSICAIIVLTVAVVFIILLTIFSVLLSPVIALELYVKNKE